MADFQFTVAQSQHFHANFTDDGGTTRPTDGTPKWSAAAPTDGTAAAGNVVVTPDADGLGCVCTADTPGAFDLTVDGDADLGAGVRDVIKTVRVTVLAAEATGVTVTADAPTPRA